MGGHEQALFKVVKGQLLRELGEITNIASLGTANQSCVTEAFPGPAELAIDGNSTGFYDEESPYNTVTHTCVAQGNWWEDDLQQCSFVKKVIVFNREDECCMTRLSDSVVELYNGDTLVASESLGDMTNITRQEVFFNQVGDKVRVQQPPESVNILSLAEVKVMGYEVDSMFCAITGSHQEQLCSVPAPKMSWEMESLNQTMVSPYPGYLVTTFPFNVSNRYYETEVFMEDCTSPIELYDGEDVVKILSVNTAECYNDGLKEIVAEVGINQAIVRETPLWNTTDESDGSGYFKFCILASLHLDENKNEVVNFQEIVFTGSLSLKGDFSVGAELDRTAAKKEDIAIDYGDYIDAYQCDTSDPTSPTKYEHNAKPTYTQGSVISICVEGDASNVVEVESFENLSVYQVGIDPFQYITDGNSIQELTTTDCTSGDAEGRICFADLKILGRFFAEEDPELLEVAGDVNLRFPDGTPPQTRRLEWRLPEKEENGMGDNPKSRYLKDDDGSGGFDVFVKLEQYRYSAGFGREMITWLACCGLLLLL